MVRLAVLLAATAVIITSAAHADWYDWAGSPSQVVSADPTGDLLTGSGAGKDITAVSWGRDSFYDYFRLDLNGPVSASDFVNLYGIYVSDGNAGTGAPSSDIIVPDDSAYNGSDYAITARYNDSGVFQYRLLSTWNGASWNNVAADWQYVSGPDTHMEWRIPVGVLPTDFWFSGGTVSLTGGGLPDITYDITGKSLTPEPGTWALLALGLPAVIWFRRRRA